MNLIDQVREQLKRLMPLPRGIVAAVSGGADSVALLRALHSLSVEKATLQVAHLNHGLRGRESDADEAFVRELCAKLGLPCHVHNLDVASIAREKGENLEAVARRLRYDWFAELATQAGCDYVATGHTSDDQAETVLLRLLRGTGLRGLRGIAARRSLNDQVVLIRPFLHSSRSEVTDYLKQLGQEYRDDRSNCDTRFARNRIRHQVLPLLKQENSAISAHLVELSEQATDAIEIIETDAARLLSSAELPRAGLRCILQQPVLAQAPRHLVCETLRMLWQREGWATGDMRRLDWERAAAVAAAECPAVDLPGPIRVRSVGSVVQIGPASSDG
jgi:tRNA(Ile)-lysidine synthase